MAEGTSVDGPASAGGLPEQGRPFVGRVRELDLVLAALGEAASGRGSFLMISGDAGIGKSRLMEVAAQRAQGLEWRVLRGSCWEGGGAPAFWPWVEVVRAAGGEFDRFAPPLEVEAGGARSRGDASRSRDPDAARFRLFDAVGRFLSEVARECPCLIVLDDLHAADAPSLLLLRFLATTASERRVVMLGSYRRGEPTVRDLADMFGELARLGQRVPLRGLGRAEVAEYIARVSDQTPTDALVDRVHDVTGGNPFFLGEVVGTLVAEDRLGGTGEPGDVTLHLPEEVRALIRRRMSGLSKEALVTLRVAAVLGREFNLRVLSPTVTLSAARLADVLAEAVRAGVVAEDAAGPGIYRFAHDLIRETLYEDLAPASRMQVHCAVGRVLERLFSPDLDSRLTEIAHHFAHAAPLGDAETEAAIDYSVRAGDRAVGLLAYEDAARLYARALRLDPTGPRKGEILLRLGDAESRCGLTESARRSYEEAAAIARQVGHADALARAALGHVTTAVPARFGLGGLMLAQVFDVETAGLALLEEAVEALPREDSPLRVRVLARLATELYTTDQTDRRLTLSREAVDMALRLGDPAALVEALHGRHWALLTPEGLSERLANANEMLTIATAAGDDEAAFLARHARLHCCLESCDADGFDAELHAMERLAGRIRQPYYLWHVDYLDATRALLHGRLDDAERRAHDARHTARLADSEFVTYAYEFTQLVTIRWAQGRMGEVADRVHQHGRDYPNIARWRDAVAAVELGDERGACAEIDRHARNRFAGLRRDGLWLLHVTALAEASVLVGDTQRGAALYDLLSPYADRNAISVSAMPLGPVALRLGMLAGMLERWDEAVHHFGLATHRCESLNAPAVGARVNLEWAKALLARNEAGDRSTAADLLGQARRACEAHDLPGILQRVDQLLAMAGAERCPDAAVGLRATFVREGDYWTVAFGTEMARLHHRKGLGYLARLLEVPGREVEVLELVRSVETGTVAPGPTEDVTAEIRPSRLGGAEPVLDPRAKAAYRQRLRELGEDLEEARAWHDPERAARIDEEIDILTRELEGALGLGGRDRRFPSPGERARVNATKAIRTAIAAIAEVCPTLGEHLARSVRTGRFCTYAPPGQAPPHWVL